MAKPVLGNPLEIIELYQENHQIQNILKKIR